MNKPESLRQHLLSSIVELRHNPDRLLVFIDQGRIRCTAAHGLSFEYGYTLNLIFTDYAGHPDAIMIPLLAWLRIHQHELLANLEQGKTAIGFEVDVLDNKKVDLSITLPLTERVIVKQLQNGLAVEHAPEPPITDHLDPGPWIVRDAEGYTIAQWQSTEPKGGEFETLHPGPTGPKTNWLAGMSTGEIITGNDD